MTVPEGSVPTPKSKAKIHQEARCAAADLHKQLPVKLQLARALACEKGASSRLTTLPLKVHGFELPKGSFLDALCLRYGWQVPRLPTTCVCGCAIEVEHALSCPFGGLPIQRHNEVRNLLASCLRKAGCDTTIKQLLQPLSGEVFHRRTTTTDQDARLDTAIFYWTYRAELTNDPSLGVNQKVNDSEAACCRVETLGLPLGTTGCATGKQ